MNVDSASGTVGSCPSSHWSRRSGPTRFNSRPATLAGEAGVARHSLGSSHFNLAVQQSLRMFERIAVTNYIDESCAGHQAGLPYRRRRGRARSAG